MEDTLRGSVSKVVYYITRRLNPCCNGRYSQRLQPQTLKDLLLSLNPCFNGRYYQSLKRTLGNSRVTSLNPCSNGRYSQSLQLWRQLTVSES